MIGSLLACATWRIQLERYRKDSWTRHTTCAISDNNGCVTSSRRIPTKVLIMVNPAAPASSSTALATWVISATLRLIWRRRSASESIYYAPGCFVSQLWNDQSKPSISTWSTLGREILRLSIALTLEAWDIFQPLWHTLDWRKSRYISDDWSRDNAFPARAVFPVSTTSTPGFCKPIALSIPTGVSATTWLAKGLPKRGLKSWPLSW